MRQIKVYFDKGVSEQSAYSTLRMLQKKFQCYQVSFISHCELNLGEWVKDTLILAVPGGADRPFQQLLHPKGTQIIREFVIGGGNYIGICAGGYFAANDIVFAPKTTYEIIEERNLKFFTGRAIGPYKGEFEYNSEKGACAIVVRTNSNLCPTSNIEVPLYLNGGCSFQIQKHNIAASKSECKVLACFENSFDPAIVMCHVGKGKALLSGVHFEVEPSDLKNRNTPTSVINILEVYNHERIELINKLIKCFDISF